MSLPVLSGWQHAKDQLGHGLTTAILAGVLWRLSLSLPPSFPSPSDSNWSLKLNSGSCDYQFKFIQIYYRAAAAAAEEETRLESIVLKMKNCYFPLYLFTNPYCWQPLKTNGRSGTL